MKNLNELNLNNKKYIIFDMDGTLIDSLNIWNITDYQLIEMFTHKKISLEEIQKERDHFLASHQTADSYLEYCDYLIKKYQISTSKEKLLQLRWDVSGAYLEKNMDFKPGVVTLINILKERGFTLVLATATTQVQIDIYTKKNKKMLKQMNLNDIFDLIIKKEDVKRKKPHPEVYLKILEHYQTDPSTCLIFEDSLHGIMAAKEAGIETINIYDKYADVDREEINKLTDYAISSYNVFIEEKLDTKEMVKA